MPRKRDLIVANLTTKGFQKSEGDHLFLVYRRIDGRKTAIRTKVSRGSSHREVSDIILSQMARQVRLSTKLFLRLIDCTLDQPGYEEVVDT